MMVDLKVVHSVETMVEWMAASKVGWMVEMKAV